MPVAERSRLSARLISCFSWNLWDEMDGVSSPERELKLTTRAKLGASVLHCLPKLERSPGTTEAGL